MTENAGPAWELSKENVQPLKVGRKVGGMLMDRNQQKLADEETEMLNDIEKEKSPEDKLLFWNRYLKWARSNFPSNSAKTLEVLEKCTNDLKNYEELKNDPRHVKVWIEYADLLQTPGEVFSFMQANKIGVRVAIFWIAWAFVAEKLTNYAMTDKIFQKGLRMQAEPKDLLQSRYKQFQRRLARHYINLSTDPDSGVTEAVEGGPARQPQEQQSKRTALQTVSSRPTTGNGDRSQVSGGLSCAPTFSTHKGARGGPAVSGNFLVYEENSCDVRRSNADLALSEAAGVGWTQYPAERVKTKENDGVTSKWTEAPLTAPCPSDPRSLSGRSSSRTRRRAEAGALPMAANGPAAEPLDIFIDPEFEAESSAAGPDRRREADRDCTGGLSIRRKLDDVDKTGAAEMSVSRRTEMILKNPLALHKQSATGTAPADGASTATTNHRECRSKEGTSKHDGKESGQALPVESASIAVNAVPTAGGFSILTESDLPPSSISDDARRSQPRSKEVTGPKSASGGGFSIFSDTENIATTAAVRTDSSAVSAPRGDSKAGPSAISAREEVYVYSHENDGVGKVEKHRHTATNTVTKRSKPTHASGTAPLPSSSKPVGVSQGFAIFSDADTVPALTPSTQSSATRSCPSTKPCIGATVPAAAGFAIFSDGPPQGSTKASAASSRKATVAKVSGDSCQGLPIGSNAPSDVSAGFKIFSDLSLTAQTSKQSQSKSRPDDAPAVNKQSVGNPVAVAPFSIFSDVNDAPNTRIICKPSVSAPTRSDNGEKTAKAVAVPSSGDSWDKLEMSCLENETINTKLAKLDIDRMFFEEEEGLEREHIETRAVSRSGATSPQRKRISGGVDGKHRDRSGMTLIDNDEGYLSPLHARNGVDDSSYSHNLMFDDSCLQFEPTRELPLGTVLHGPVSAKSKSTGGPSSVLAVSDDESSQNYFRYSTSSSLSSAERRGRRSAGSTASSTAVHRDSTGSGGAHSLLLSPSPSSDTSISKSYLYGCGVQDDNETATVGGMSSKRRTSHSRSHALAAIREQQHELSMSADEDCGLESLLRNGTSKGSTS